MCLKIKFSVPAQIPDGYPATVPNATVSAHSYGSSYSAQDYFHIVVNPRLSLVYSLRMRRLLITYKPVDTLTYLKKYLTLIHDINKLIDRLGMFRVEY